MCLEIHCQNGHSHRKCPATPERSEDDSLFKAKRSECESLFTAERSDRESLVNTTGSDCESLFNGDCLAGDSLFGEANCGSARFIARKVPNFFARPFSAALM
jgi:hypothetical protein